MARTKINDLHKDMKISKEEMKNVVGGAVDTFLQIDGIPSEELCLAGGDKTPYMKNNFEGVIVSSVSIGGGGGGTPTESVTFNY